MAILRSSEIRGMDDSEMDEQCTQLRKDLMKMKGVLASGGIPEGVGRIREIKRTIARIMTEKASKSKTANKEKTEKKEKAVKAVKTEKKPAKKVKEGTSKK